MNNTITATSLDAFNVGDVWNRRPTIHEQRLCAAVACRGLLTLPTDGVVLASADLVDDTYIEYLAKVRYPDHPTQQQNFIQRVLRMDTKSTQHDELIEVFNTYRTEQSVDFTDSAILRTYVQGESEQIMAENFGLQLGHVPCSNPNQFRHKGEFVTTCEKAGVANVPHTMIITSTDELTPAIVHLFNDGHTAIIVRQSLAGGGGGNIVVQRKIDDHFTITEPNGTCVRIDSEANVCQYLEAWNSTNNDGVVLAPLVENAVPFSATISMNALGQTTIQYTAKEITEHYSFMGCEVNMNGKEAHLEQEILKFLHDFGSKIHAETNFVGDLQLDFIVSTCNGNVTVYPTESNFGRWTSPRQSAAVVRTLTVKDDLAYHTCAPFFASDHLETSAKTTQQVLAGLQNVTGMQIHDTLGDRVSRYIQSGTTVDIGANCIATIPLHTVQPQSAHNNIGVIVTNTELDTSRNLGREAKSITLQILQKSHDLSLTVQDCRKLVEHVLANV